MANPFSAADITKMRATWDASLQDTCEIGARTATADSFGQMIETFTYGAATACGIQYTASAESQRSQGGLLVIDARLRLSVGTTLTHRDRVQLTYQNGELLAPARVYDVVGYPQPHVTGVVVDLRAVS